MNKKLDIFVLKMQTKDGEQFSDTYFTDIESAMKAFADNTKIGNVCMLLNLV